MNIVILNGDVGQEGSDFSEYLEKLAEEFKLNHTVQIFTLGKMNLHYCTGCWTCWWKTPGRCAINDDAEEIYRAVINSDFFIFASPLIAGFTSSLLKKITDRFIVFLHPYIKITKGESHHLMRYSKFPNFGLILGREKDTDDDDLEIISDIYDRFAVGFHCEKKYLKLIDQSNPKEIVYET